MRALTDAAHRFESWIVRDALPFWWQTARDPNGGYVEDVTPDGHARLSATRRVRVQARQAYVYAHAHLLGWHDDARAASDHGFSQLIGPAAMSTSSMSTADDLEQFDGFVHRLHPDHSVADPRRDTYDHAFGLLACAWRIKAFNDPQAKTVATAIMAYLDAYMGMADGSFQESCPVTLPRRQNPHMHLFEAFMALADATGDARYTERATKVYNLFLNHFHDADKNIIYEFFGDDWSLDATQGHIVEPGHMAEWCWLLDQYQTLTGTDTRALCRALLPQAQTLGIGPLGLMADQVSIDPSRPITESAHRTWVQTEHLKGCLVLARHGVPGMAARAVHIVDHLFQYYLNTPFSGGHKDQLNADGATVSTVCPTSTLYHLISAAAELKATADIAD